MGCTGAASFNGDSGIPLLVSHRFWVLTDGGGNQPLYDFPLWRRSLPGSDVARNRVLAVANKYLRKLASPRTARRLSCDSPRRSYTILGDTFAGCRRASASRRQLAQVAHKLASIADHRSSARIRRFAVLGASRSVARRSEDKEVVRASWRTGISLDSPLWVFLKRARVRFAS